MAQAVRAGLLAMATVTSRVGLRPMSDLTQAPVRVSVVSARLVTEVAPKTSKRRKYPLPIFEIRPMRSLPPDEFLRGTRPRKAANYRPDLKKDGSNTLAASVGPFGSIGP